MDVDWYILLQVIYRPVLDSGVYYLRPAVTFQITAVYQ